MRVVPLEEFRALALGQATLPEPMVVELARPTAAVHVKGAHLAGVMTRSGVTGELGDLAASRLPGRERPTRLP